MNTDKPESDSIDAQYEHEHALIACCLEDPTIVDQLTKDLFGDERAGAIFDWLNQRRHDRVERIEWAHTMFDLSKAHFGLYVVALQWAPLCHSSANWSYWEEQVRESSVFRNSAKVGKELIDNSKDGSVDLQSASSKLLKIESERHRKASSSIGVVVDATLAEMEFRYGLDKSYSGVSTGFPLMDLKTDGLTQKALWVIAARPSVGKTTLGCNIAIQTAIRDRQPTAFFSLEMPAKQIGQKLFHAISGVSQDKRKRRVLAESEFAKLGEAALRIRNSPLHIIDSCRSIQAIGAEIRRLKADGGIRIVIVDYLQRVSIDGSEEDRWNDIGRVSNALKNIAMDEDITVIALAQLSREFEKQKREPTLADLRGSAEIEADSDVVAFLWLDDDKLTLTIEKARMGSTGKVPITADLDTGIFQEERERPDDHP